MKKMIYTLCFVCITLSYSQENSTEVSFYIRIPDLNNAPVVSYTVPEDIVLSHQNTEVQAILNRHEVSHFVKAFPNSITSELQDLYYIKTDRIGLMNELSSSFSNMFTYFEEIPKIEILLETNDYGLAWNREQKNLDLINAKQAWDYTTGSPNVLVGISDLPIRTNHEDLFNKVVGYTNTTTTAFHGTEVAGVVASLLVKKSAIIKQTDNISFFDNNTFVLQHFLVDGVQQDLVLTYHGGEVRDAPKIIFTFNTETNKLEATLHGYCNTGAAEYIDRGTYLEVIYGGLFTLQDCGDENDFAYPVTGFVGGLQPREKVFYEITQDRAGLWLWLNENNKLHFTKETLSIEEKKTKNSIKIYPNPANNYIEIQANNIRILEISIIDIQGKVVLKKVRKFKKIDVSKFTSGMYFIKLKSEKATITKKIIIARFT